MVISKPQRALAIEWAERRIRVNAVGPAYVATEMTQRNIVAGNADEAQIKGRIPLGRLAQPVDMTDAVSFLLSDKAAGWLAVCRPQRSPRLTPGAGRGKHQ